MRNRLLQLALGLVFLGILIQVVLIAPSQIRDSEKSEAQAKPAEAAAPGAAGGPSDQSINGMHTIETQEGRKEWELWSDRATSLKAKDTVELEKPHALFFAESGVTFDVTGSRGSVETKARNLSIQGDVVTHTTNGYVFRTESMEYASTGRQLSASKAVVMDSPHDSKGHYLHVNGIGMRASLLHNNMEILSEVRAEKGIEHDRTAYIKSNRAFFSSKDRSARFQENVVLDLETMRITGPEARFEYDSKSDVIKTVYFSGGVRVSDTDKFATAQNVSIDFVENRFVFSGDPRVVQNNDELRGQEIIFLDGGKQVEVRRARARVDEKRAEKKN